MLVGRVAALLAPSARRDIAVEKMAYSVLKSSHGRSAVAGWTKDDVHAVLSGLAGRGALRGMLARLQPKEEVLLLGWGVPMPLPVKSRRYDDTFWDKLLGKKSGPKKGADDLLKDIGF